MRPSPEGGFSMGYAAGRDDEKPAHRVWVDAFELAAYQTTNEDYAYFLDATRHSKPLHWSDPNFNHPKQPVVAVSWFRRCRILRNGMSPRERQKLSPPNRSRMGARSPWRGWMICSIHGATASPKKFPTIPGAGKQGQSPSAFSRRTRTGFSMSETTCTNGAPIGTKRITMRALPRTKIRAGHRRELERASRGGSWRHHIKVSRRTAARSSIPAEFKYADYGFRIARPATI